MIMNEQWTRFLDEAGGTHSASVDPRATSFICDLSGEYALAAFTGDDAEAFLHGQLSSDVKALSPDRSQLATYNTPKGRVLATMLLWRSQNGFLAQLPATVVEGVMKRLSMYVLRSKVHLANVSERFVRIGVGGLTAEQVLASAGVSCPKQDFVVTRSASGGGPDQPDFVLRVPTGRFELLYSDLDAAISAWKALCRAGTQPTDSTPWQWLSVRSGIPEILTKTQDMFIPQMLNLELLGAVSFTKGCYPGQEIVARTQYRGEIKRRTFLGHLDASSVPALGDGIVAATTPPQQVGSISAVARAPSGGYDVLVCLHVGLASAVELHLAEADGPRLALLDLPYPLPATV